MGILLFPTISSSAITYENLTSRKSIQKESRQSLGEVDAMSSEFSDKCVKSLDEGRQKLGRQSDECRQYLVPGDMKMRHRYLIIRY